MASGLSREVAGCDENSADSRIRSSKCVICSSLSGSCVLWDWGAEASREERHSGVNYELAARSRHSQGSLTF
jgi:hypothetical protein